MALPAMRTGESRHPGHVIRVFAEDIEDLYIVQKALQGNDRIHGYISYGRHLPVPAQVDKWIEYRRYRIPGTQSRLEKCRDYRMKSADLLPYVRMSSKNTGQAFSLYFLAVPFDGREVNSMNIDCLPDSYGLSVPDRKFCVPDLPMRSTKSYASDHQA